MATAWIRICISQGPMNQKSNPRLVSNFDWLKIENHHPAADPVYHGGT